MQAAFLSALKSIATPRPFNLDSKKKSTAARVVLRVARIDEAQDRLFEWRRRGLGPNVV
jgi:hypothetical protein